MRMLIQRVTQAQVEVDGQVTDQIGNGLLILLGVEHDDTTEDASWLAQKVVSMRIFSDDADKMNRDIREVGGEILLVSQFTLHAATKKGNRPSFIRAARPEHAIPLYEATIQELGALLGKRIATGQFGAMMNIHLVNDGPVTIWMDSKNKE
jgi:D-tyrosyl-tRNA(Tyr) deacylase